jgi:membrane protein CcdC involved in cytochrome C biogenesis
MIFAGILSALGLLFLIFKFGIRRIITYDIPIDIAVTGFLMYVFAGTYSGMIAAMVGGLIVSVVLYTLKRTMRREELQLVKTSNFPYRAVRWVGVQP